MDINAVVLIGRLTRDVETKKTQSNKSVASFSIACNRMKRQGADEEADFINCVAWNGSADFLERYTKKGNRIGVKGRLQTRAWTDNDGKNHYVTEVLCDQVELLESRQSQGVQLDAQVQPLVAQNQVTGSFEVSSDIDPDDLPF